MSTTKFTDALTASKSGLTFKFSEFTKLEGQENYSKWCAAMKIMLRNMGCLEIVVDGAAPASDAPTTEVSAFTLLQNNAAAAMIQVVNSTILDQIVELEDPHKMWLHLKEQYYRDNSLSFIYQMRAFNTLLFNYSSSDKISDFITNFETEWLRLSQLAAASKDPYRVAYSTFLKEDKAKRDFLLSAMAQVHPNVVDNLSTKDDNSYSDCKRHLLGLEATNLASKSSDVALATVQRNQRSQRQSGPSAPSPSAPGTPKKSPVCTWCKKHLPGKENGHWWTQCSKAKEFSEKKKKEKASSSEQAHVTSTTTSKVREVPFTFDTAASSHMVPSLDRFEHFQICTGSYVGSSSSEAAPMKIEGKGTVVLDCVLLNGAISTFRIRDVLYVPALDRPLFSWKAIMNKGFTMNSTSTGISVLKSGKTMLEARLDHTGLFTIPELTHQAYSTYGYWHQALGHIAPSSLEKAKKLYTDGAQIPSCPPNFNCDSCILAKSTRSTPKPSTSISKEAFDLILSDLCGPFPVPSYGGHLYYISFIDDATRFTWIRFLKKKSDTFDVIRQFIEEIRVQHGKTIKRFRFDNGGEYIDARVTNLLKDNGIINDPTPAYSPETLGIAERFNRTMGEAIRSMLLGLGPNYNKRLWAEAAGTGTYLKNRVPHKRLKDKTPYEALSGNKPSVLHLHPFGQKCFAHIPKASRKAGSKLLPRAAPGIFVGYTPTTRHYRVFLPEGQRVIISHDVHFPNTGSEGVTSTVNATPSPSSPSNTDTFTPTSIPADLEVPINVDGFPSTAHWIEWADRNPDTANQWYHRGHPKVVQVFNQAFNDGKRSGFLGPPYWEWDNNNHSQHSSQYSEQPQAHSQHSDDEDTAPQEQQLVLRDSFDDRMANTSVQPVDRTPRTEHPPPATWSIDSNAIMGNTPQSWIPHPVPPVRQRNPPGEWWKAEIPSQQPVAPQAPAPSESTSSQESVLATYSIDNDHPEPKSLAHAKTLPDWPEWNAAAQSELDSLKENDVYDVVDLPPGRKVVGSRWVFKVKQNSDGSIERYKARLVAQGFSQQPGVDFDEIFSPVVRYDSLRLLLALSASKGWRPRQLDIKTAFLYGILKEEVYMQLPEGSRIAGKVAKLNRCIYGLKQSPREWYSRLVTFLTPYGFACSTFDPCVLVHDSGDFFIAIYVDDLTLFGPSDSLMDKLVAVLKSEFKVNDLGPVHWLLGIQIEMTPSGIYSIATHVHRQDSQTIQNGQLHACIPSY